VAATLEESKSIPIRDPDIQLIQPRIDVRNPLILGIAAEQVPEHNVLSHKRYRKQYAERFNENPFSQLNNLSGPKKICHIFQGDFES
jgi:hypothetical protein